MNCRFLSQRLGRMCLAATVGCLAAMLGGTVYADLLWYDGFEITDVDDGAGPAYLAGNINGQQGGAGVGAGGAGPGFFDDGAGDPNPWLGVNSTDVTADDSYVSAGSLTRAGQVFPSLGGKADGGPELFGCCHTSRTSRDFNAATTGVDGSIFMSFLVNWGSGNPADPHYRAIEFWNGKRVELVDDGMGGMVPGPADGRVGDQVLDMALGVSSFGNFNDAVNQGADPNPNTQLSIGLDGVRTEFGSIENSHHQFEEHLEYAAMGQTNTRRMFPKTHAIVLEFVLSTSDKELGGVGDTVRAYLNPPSPLAPPTPSFELSGIDLNLDSMSNMILFHFTGVQPNQGAFDELRVGTTWGDVAPLQIPEPASLSLFGLASLGLALAARRMRS